MGLWAMLIAMGFYLSCVLYLVGGIDAMPRWAWALLLVQRVLSLEPQTYHFSDVILVTDLFVRSCRAAIVCVRDLHVFHYTHSCTGQPSTGGSEPSDGSSGGDGKSSGATVDWAATYRNYDALCDFVHNYSRGWVRILVSIRPDVWVN